MSYLLALLPSMGEFTTALPVMLAIFFIDGLLSFDNALVLATMVKHLPEKRQKLALRAGLLGAFLMRGASLFFVGFLISNPWIKLVGAIYLIYLMCTNLAVGEGGDDEEEKAAKVRGLLATVFFVEIADMAFSLDNIIATVAMSSKIWVVCLGVFMSIIVMRFVAGIFVGLVKKFPILEKVSYVLVGFIGFQLAAEYLLHFEMSDVQKFAGVLAIAVAGMVYEKASFLHPVFDPIFNALGIVMGKVALVLEFIAKPVTIPVSAAFGAVKGIFKKSEQ